MNKREMIHALIDRLLDVAESETKKELFFNYHTHASLGVETFGFYFYEGNGSREYVIDNFDVRFGGAWNHEKQFNQAIAHIELIKSTPDVEPKVSLSLTVEKARELGLIA